MTFEYELAPTGHVNACWIDEEGQRLRRSFAPGEPLDGVPEDAQAEIETVWTPEFVTEWRAANAPLPPTLDEAKAAFEARVRAYRWEQHNKVTFGGKIFASDDTAATRLVAAITARSIAQAAGLEASNATAKWEAMDGTMVPMTLTEQRQLLLTGVARTQACFDRQAILLAAGDAAPDQAALDAIDISTGWPA